VPLFGGGGGTCVAPSVSGDVTSFTLTTEDCEDEDDLVREEGAIVGPVLGLGVRHGPQ
jgi:hypothetical protein